MDSLKPGILNNLTGKSEEEKMQIFNFFRKLVPYIEVKTQVADGKIKAIAFEGKIIFKDKEKANGG